MFVELKGFGCRVPPPSHTSPSPLTHLTPPPHPTLRYDLGNNYAGVARVGLPIGAKVGSTLIVTCTEYDEDSLVGIYSVYE